MDENETRLFSKKADELTVGESLKISAGATVVVMVIPVAVIGAIAGVESIAAKLKERKLAKANEDTKE